MEYYNKIKNENIKILKFIRINSETKCWEWIGYRNEKGYGKYNVSINGKQKNVRAHRYIYQITKGEIPSGLVIDHTCVNRCCVNPDHLRLATFMQNMKENINKKNPPNHAKTKCKNGHDFNNENTRTIKGKWRECKICDRLRRRKPSI